MISNLANIDRRWIFVLILLAVAIPTLYKFDMPIKASTEVKAVYDYIENLPEGSPILVSLDYDPSSKPELYPMALALFKHMYRKNHRVIGMTHYPQGADLAKQAMEEAKTQFMNLPENKGKKEVVEGEDYVFLGYAAGYFSLVLNMGEDLYSAYPTDTRGVATKDIPALKGVRSLKDLKYMVVLSSGSTPEMWVVYGKEKYNFTMAAGCTAVMAPDLYPFLQAEQINGLLGGIKGAWEYEDLIGQRAKAYEAVPAQSTVHAVVIILIFLCNLGYFFSRRGN